jgi:hypothetical protein
MGETDVRADKPAAFEEESEEGIESDCSLAHFKGPRKQNTRNKR